MFNFDYNMYALYKERANIYTQGLLIIAISYRNVHFYVFFQSKISEINGKIFYENVLHKGPSVYGPPPLRINE